MVINFWAWWWLVGKWTSYDLQPLGDDSYLFLPTTVEYVISGLQSHTHTSKESGHGKDATCLKHTFLAKWMSRHHLFHSLQTSNARFNLLHSWQIPKFYCRTSFPNAKQTYKQQLAPRIITPKPPMSRVSISIVSWCCRRRWFNENRWMQPNCCRHRRCRAHLLLAWWDCWSYESTKNIENKHVTLGIYLEK